MNGNNNVQFGRIFKSVIDLDDRTINLPSAFINESEKVFLNGLGQDKEENDYSLIGKIIYIDPDLEMRIGDKLEVHYCVEI